jgi:hypothetical protein
VNDISGRLLRAGYTKEQIETTLHDYEVMDVWHVTRNKDEVRFLQGQLRFAR